MIPAGTRRSAPPRCRAAHRSRRRARPTPSSATASPSPAPTARRRRGTPCTRRRTIAERQRPVLRDQREHDDGQREPRQPRGTIGERVERVVDAPPERFEEPCEQRVGEPVAPGSSPAGRRSDRRGGCTNGVGNRSNRRADATELQARRARRAPTRGHAPSAAAAVRSTRRRRHRWRRRSSTVWTPRRAGRGRSCGRRCRAIVRRRRRRRSGRRCRAAAGSAGRSWCAPGRSGRRSSRHRASPTAR